MYLGSHGAGKDPLTNARKHLLLMQGITHCGTRRSLTSLAVYASMHKIAALHQHAHMGVVRNA